VKFIEFLHCTFTKKLLNMTATPHS
jgi:hypothetical protein